MNNEKFEFTGDTKEISICGVVHTVHRIRAKVDIENPNGRTIKAGELGGWIGDGSAIGMGKCWVADEAIVLGHGDNDGEASTVAGDALVAGHAIIAGDVWVHDNALVDGNAVVIGYGVIGDRAHVGENATVIGDVSIRYSKVLGSAVVMNPQYFIDLDAPGVDENMAQYLVITDRDIGGFDVVCEEAGAGDGQESLLRAHDNAIRFMIGALRYAYGSKQ